MYPSIEFLYMTAVMLAELKRLANKRDIPYQTLLKILLAERLEEELPLERFDGEPRSSSPTS